MSAEHSRPLRGAVEVDCAAVAYQRFDVQMSGWTRAGHPDCIAVKWSDPAPLTETIAGFSIERTEPLWQETVGREQHSVMTPCDMKPDTKAHFKVCVLYANADADLSALDDQPDPANQPKPTPRIVDGHSGQTFIGFKWEAGFDYAYYYIHYTPQDGPMRTLKHDDDGGLAPDRVYKVEVQGCTSGLFGSKCYGWSPTKEIKTRRTRRTPGRTPARPASSGGKRSRATRSAWRRPGEMR
jgi:hypothetical protein